MSGRFKLSRIVRRDRPFTVAMVLGGMLGILVLVGVPKVWRTTPQGFPFGVVRVSALDLLQAWSLTRAARRAGDAGHDDEAVFAWRGAMANNLGDPGIHRGALRFLRSARAVASDRTLFAIQTASWLVALTRTNAADVALIGEVLERHGRPKVALNWLSAIPEGRDDAVERARAKCLLSAGKLEAFAEVWRVRGDGWKDDPILALSYDAWRATTDDRTAGLEATVRLKQALGDPGERGLVAARLLVLVGGAKGQADDMGRALEVLEARGSATPAQHAQYWRVLRASGQEAEAKRLAKDFQRETNDAEMAGAVWRALREIGEPEEALARAERSLERYGNSVEAWRVYFELLLDAKRWKEAMRAVANARLVAGVQEPLYAEAMLAEYRAVNGEDRVAEAGRIAREFVGLRLTDPDLVVRISATLRSGGRPRDALRFLDVHEEVLRDLPAYWSELFSVGLAAKEIPVLRRSVDEWLKRAPRSLAWVNNQAALLLITGDDPAEALRLTLAGLSRSPGSPALRINHAMALHANGRSEEAERMLASVAGAKLSPEGLANYYLALAEVEMAMGRASRALLAATQVDRDRLLAPQLDRLDRVTTRARALGSGGG